MAGDWIKFEHATIDKPEVAFMADLLGIKPDEAIGLLVRFWVWMDRNARNGSVTHVTQQTLDNTMHCPGFGAAIVTVGWAEIDAKTHTLTAPNFGRHNENSAKTRSSNAERQAKYREKQRNESNVTTVTEALPEKRREEKRDTSLRSVSSAPPKRTAISEPSTEHRSLAETLGVPCDAEFEKYRDWLAANGRRQNQDAGFRNWLRKAAEFKPKQTVAERRSDVADQMFRRGKYAIASNAERDVTGVAERLD